MIFVDTNILLDVVTDDPVWADWSQHQLDAAALLDRLAINPVVHAEFSSRFRRVEDIDEVLMTADIVVTEMPRMALFLAGQAFKTYRHRGGLRTSVLPDFFVGAQAAVAGSTLITRDANRYRTYFPAVALIAPE